VERASSSDFVEQFPQQKSEANEERGETRDQRKKERRETSSMMEQQRFNSSSMMCALVLLLLAMININNYSEAFVVQQQPSSMRLANQQRSFPHSGVAPSAVAVPRSSFGLFMAEEKGEAGDAKVDTTDEVVSEVVNEEEEAKEEETPEPSQEDVELAALKKEIASLEKDLKEKRRAATLTSDQAEEFTSAGYARKVAEMEQMRRTRRVSTNVHVHFLNSTTCIISPHST
jgi:hypothetical protein